MAEMITKGKNTLTGKSVLLFSGGMDSLMMGLLIRPDVWLYLPHGEQYEERETQCIAQLVHHPLLKGINFQSCVSLNLHRFERDDAIIPGRNLYFLLLAANWGERLYFASVYGDRSLDKSPEFFSKTEEILNLLYQDQHWCEGRTFQILAPYKNHTKTELVGEYLREGYPVELLLESYSCYEGRKQPCGWCKPCFRKWVALKNNDVTFPTNYFERPPWEAPWLEEILPSVRLRTYRGREDEEILMALEKKGIE